MITKKSKLVDAFFQKDFPLYVFVDDNLVFICAHGFKDNITFDDFRPPVEHVQACKKWIQKYLTASDRIDKNGSYFYKHQVERSEFAKDLGPCVSGYITNGAFIQAACELELGVLRDGQNAFLFARPNKEFRQS